MPAGPLTSVFGNLLRNAIQFMIDAETAVRSIRIRVEACDELVVIVFEDTGPGIPAGMDDTIFEPFVRAHDSRSSGIGLGLSTVRRIVDAHGGSIHVPPSSCSSRRRGGRRRFLATALLHEAFAPPT